MSRPPLPIERTIPYYRLCGHLTEDVAASDWQVSARRGAVSCGKFNFEPEQKARSLLNLEHILKIHSDLHLPENVAGCFHITGKTTLTTKKCRVYLHSSLIELVFALVFLGHVEHKRKCTVQYTFFSHGCLTTAYVVPKT